MRGGTNQYNVYVVSGKSTRFHFTQCQEKTHVIIERKTMRLKCKPSKLKLKHARLKNLRDFHVLHYVFTL